MEEPIHKRWKNVPRTRLVFATEQANRTTLGRLLDPQALLPYSVCLSELSATVTFRAVRFYLGECVYLIDIYSSRHSLKRLLERTLAELGFENVSEDHCVWHYLRHGHAGRIVPCEYSLRQLKPRVLNCDVLFARIEGSGLWIDPTSLILLAGSTPHEDVANILAHYREEEACWRWLDEEAKLKLPRLRMGLLKAEVHARIIFIVDTNVLLNKIHRLQEVRREMQNWKPKLNVDCCYCVPWIVMKELEGLSKRQLAERRHGCFHPISHLARLAMGSLLEELGNRTGVVFMETREEFRSSLKLKTTLQMRSFSSLILLSCLGVIRQTLLPENIHGRIVVLVSDDWELMADAALHGIAACSTEAFPNRPESIHATVEQALGLLRRSKMVLGLGGLLTNAGEVYSRTTGFQINPANTLQNGGPSESSCSNGELLSPTSARSEKTWCSRESLQTAEPPPVCSFQVPCGEHWLQTFFAETAETVEIYFGPSVQFWHQARFPQSCPFDNNQPWTLHEILTVLIQEQEQLPKQVAQLNAQLHAASRMLEGPSVNREMVYEFTVLWLKLANRFPAVLMDVFFNVDPLPPPLCVSDGQEVWKRLTEAATRLAARCAFLDGVWFGAHATKAPTEIARAPCADVAPMIPIPIYGLPGLCPQIALPSMPQPQVVIVAPPPPGYSVMPVPAPPPLPLPLPPPLCATTAPKAPPRSH